MNRTLIALLAALESFLAVAIGVGISLIPLSIMWAARLDLDIGWEVFWRASADIWLVGHGVDLTITLDPAAVVSQLDHARDADAALSRMLRGKAGVYEFFYEDLTVDDALAPAFVSLVTSLTGRPFDKPVTARTVKLARPLPDLVENFDAIAAVLRGTEYEPLLSMV